MIRFRQVKKILEPQPPRATLELVRGDEDS